MMDLTVALGAGMTPIIAYSSSSNVAALDGLGREGKGPCALDRPKACPSSVRFYGFSVENIGCEWGEWEPWSACTAGCNSMQRRTRSNAKSSILCRGRDSETRVCKVGAICPRSNAYVSDVFFVKAILFLHFAPLLISLRSSV